MMDSLQTWFDRLVGVKSAQAGKPQGMDAYMEAIQPARRELDVPACWRRAPKVKLTPPKDTQ